MYFACRHHILEILLEAVFSSLIAEQSKGPEVVLFQNLRDMWQQIDQTKYATAADDEATMLKIQPWREEVIQFAQTHLREQQPRDDSKDFPELTIAFLGSVPHSQSSVRFKAPGALHCARWMARAIYALKLWMFLDQFQQLRPKRSLLRGPNCEITFREKLTDFCVFVVRYYVRAWFSANSAAAAPQTDLSLLKELASDKNQAIRKVGTTSLSRHLWYLSEVTVGLALFDDEVPNQEKREMVHCMNTV